MNPRKSHFLLLFLGKDMDVDAHFAEVPMGPTLLQANEAYRPDRLTDVPIIGLWFMSPHTGTT